MANSNYLIAFLQDVDILISEINRLESKARLYRRSCDIFDMAYDVKFSISPDSFVELRSFLSKKIDENVGYDKKIADLRREFLRSISLIKSGIQREFDRIEMAQKQGMNAIVYRAVYESRISNEVKLRDSFDVKSGLMDILLGVKKYRRLAFENHDLKASCLEREYAEKKCEEKSIFELVCLIENCEVKTGSLLCLEDDIIKTFMIDRSGRVGSLVLAIYVNKNDMRKFPLGDYSFMYNPFRLKRILTKYMGEKKIEKKYRLFEAYI